MTKRSGFEKVIRAIARETAKQQRLNENQSVALRFVQLNVLNASNSEHWR